MMWFIWTALAAGKCHN